MDNEDKIVLGITLGLVILIPSIAFLFVETYIPAEIVIGAILGIVIFAVTICLICKLFKMLKHICDSLDTIQKILSFRNYPAPEIEFQKEPSAAETKAGSQNEVQENLSELDIWKQKALKNVEDAVATGRIDPEKGIELSNRIQEAKQIPVKKNKENAGA